MTLRPQSDAKHNRMLGLRTKHHLSENHADDGNAEGRHAKKPRLSDEGSEYGSDLPGDEVYEEIETAQPGRTNLQDKVRPTGLEIALPLVQTDQDAIDHYESSQAAKDQEEAPDGTLHRLNSRKWVPGKSSIYVDAFNMALETVLDEEEHLFSEAERVLFKNWNELSYEAQFLYVRLFLRKTSAWHRTKSLRYYNDIGDLEGPIKELQEKRILPPHTTPTSSFPDALDMQEDQNLEREFCFADSSDLIITLDEATTLLKLDELKALAKEAKIQGKNKAELARGLRKASKQQVGIKAVLRRSDTDASRTSVSTAVEDSETDENGNGSRRQSPDIDSNRDTHFLRKILDETGPCIRLSLAPLLLFERVHLVFYRSSEWTEKSLTTMILARIAKRNFPEYFVSRSASIFESRDLLLEFEAALRAQHKVDNILEMNGKPTEEGLQTVIEIHNSVLPRWRELVAHEQSKESQGTYQSGEGAYLRRLSPAWVYTRIIHKAALHVLHKLKRHQEQHDIVTELLDQRLFHHARRGAWYQRKALIEEHYLAAIHASDGRVDDILKRKWKRIALQTCEEGIEDPMVHLIYHHDLQKRITKLEKACRIPKREQHDFSHVRLAAPVEVYVEGVRIEQDVDDVSSRRNSGDLKQSLKSTKTIWLDPLEENGECSVEAMCLSHYRSQGWKGYHSEGRISRTLFAYLFFDVMFLYVPNVFQTPFQTCPLDLHTDAFYPTRMSEINHRLVQIENGMAPSIIKEVWDANSEKQTCVVGLDWAYELEDLLEISQLFSGYALATICKVFCQEYGTRGGGMPDLFLWHVEKKEIKFSEVKSENDRLSDTQRLWIDVLTGAGVKVELCHAVAKKT
ncbi:hypothetical protein BT63DRAFT_445297 [Microthyrium microscopicum]|uniref:Fanconi-associated nuclease n=1 Tax=Microthyrium microscopicum TaxID=703497 RepID=A0A6A6UUG8_9PEZI|nr:hypothetical protein BT63DRAFT_445297 [Microthyrium microscopicum]